MPVDRHVVEIEQQDVYGYPGWRLRTGKNAEGKTVTVSYFSPLGEEWTRAKFRDAVDNGEIKKTVEKDPTEEVAKREVERRQAETTAKGSTDDKWEAVDLPETQLRKTPKSTPELASAGDLAMTATIGLLIITHMLSTFILNVPEAAMTQEEAQGLAVPIGNILASSSLNKKYGKYLRDSSDYTLLGYGLYAYMSRVASQVRYRKEMESRNNYNGTIANISPVTRVNSPPATRGTKTGTEPDRTGSSANGNSTITLPASGGIAAKAQGIIGYNPVSRKNP